jgi:uncharacterized protein YegP (UPF0339 family)
MKAIIKKVNKGKRVGQFKFKLVGDNGEDLSQNESYTQKHNVMEVLTKYFPNFVIVDETVKD